MDEGLSLDCELPRRCNYLSGKLGGSQHNLIEALFAISKLYIAYVLAMDDASKCQLCELNTDM